MNENMARLFMILMLVIMGVFSVLSAIKKCKENQRHTREIERLYSRSWWSKFRGLS